MNESCCSLPPVGDLGQRYEVHYVDTETRQDHVFGWSDRYPWAFLRSIDVNPSMISGRVFDRVLGRRATPVGESAEIKRGGKCVTRGRGGPQGSERRRRSDSKR